MYTSGLWKPEASDCPEAAVTGVRVLGTQSASFAFSVSRSPGITPKALLTLP